jgi:hypothetical protein
MSPRKRLVAEVVIAVVVIVLTLVHVMPLRSSPNYWWVVLGIWVLAILIRLYRRATTGSWQNPRSRGQDFSATGTR